jgi:hypothetical protein
MHNSITTTFGAWTYDPADNTITFEPNGYYLHRDWPDNTAAFWLRQLRGKSWYKPLVVYGTDADPNLIRAMKFAGWMK